MANPVFEDSNKNGKLDKAEILAALATPDIRIARQVRAIFAEFGPAAKLLNKDIKEKTVNISDLEQFAIRLNKRLNDIIDSDVFPEGVTLTAADMPAIIALFCATAR